MLNQLQNCLTNSEKNKSLVGLIVIDVRDFRELNRSFGEDCGNTILDTIYLRLVSLAAQQLETFYLGNDEFAIVIPKLKSPGFAVLNVEWILSKFKEIFEWNKHTLKITVNCGVAYNYEAHSDAYKLLYDAEVALSQAKALNQPFQMLGKNEQQQSDQLKWELLNSLHEAMQDNELTLYYQPKICLHDNLNEDNTINKSLQSSEVLIRWENQTHGLLSPDVTLPLIEHLGSEIELIRWLINTALKHISDSEKPRSVSINIPATSVTSQTLYQVIAEALAIWQVNPAQLTLEITEDVLIRDKELAFDYLSKVRETGVKIAIDDFGTGYSSLAYFKHIPADELKIDRAFIKNMLHDESDRNIVKLIIELAHSFKLLVVAEGVEDQETLDLLRAMKCDYAQGFLISKPMPYKKYMQWLADD